MFSYYASINHQITFAFFDDFTGYEMEKLHTSFTKSKKPRQMIICLSITFYNCQKQLKDKDNHIYKTKEKIKF